MDLHFLFVCFLFCDAKLDTGSFTRALALIILREGKNSEGKARKMAQPVRVPGATLPCRQPELDAWDMNGTRRELTYSCSLFSYLHMNAGAFMCSLQA